LGLALIPLTIVLATFALLAKERPGRRPRNAAASAGTGAARARGADTGAASALTPTAQMLAGLAHRDIWWFCLFYSVTFGGYVGLSSFLPLLLRDQYALDPLHAGYATALVAFVGSGSRPLGGYVADRIGGIRVLTAALSGVALVYAMAARLPEMPVML